MADPEAEEWLRRFRAAKVYKQGRFQLWSSLCNLYPNLPFVLMGIGVVALAVYAFAMATYIE